ncbi:MAG TPA: 16S rRNA (adenine(1518)-N(6)/adenine(1519)-N(6))-dimethyltransferase RsmA [bacterium]|nr:16S rRNA (adenine(1518)-N(6)/adenine(1519)-N(6))-dimethyltransferase RsmA [bacterium]
MPPHSGATSATPAGTRALLREFGIRPTKRWGQHFLVSARALEAIVAAAELTRGDTVLEIGAGLGTLTEALAARAGAVSAIEVDRRLVPVLAARLGGLPNVRIVEGDALHVDLPPLFGDAPARKVVANLPYNIAAPLLLRLLDPALSIARLIVAVQREVGERVVARPGTASYGRLSIAVQYRAAARIVARIPPGAFLPAPDVESAVLTLVPHARPPVQVDDEAAFFRVVAAGFGHRRKMLANALAQGLDLPPSAVDAACRAAGVDPRARAETLDLEAFAALARTLARVRRPIG